MTPSNSITSSNLSVTEAQQQIQASIVAITEAEQLELPRALNRILAQDIFAPMDVPAFNNSAMDGYAFCGSDGQTYQELNIVGQAYAGHPYPDVLTSDQAIRITTGAPMPPNADTVLPQELAVIKGATILDLRNTSIRRGQNSRLRGEDIAKDSVVLKKGTRLTPAGLGLLASLGLPHVGVQRPLRVAIFSTGDELRSPDQQPLPEGCAYDSNRVSLGAMLTLSGAEVVDLGILADDVNVIRAALSQAAHQVDVIITSGGVSVGAMDYTKQVLQQLGDMQFWSVNMRPGRPLAFGSIKNNIAPKNTYVFGLPGNPVAMMISFYLFVRPALQLLAGTQIKTSPLIPAIASEAIPKKWGRSEFQRGICTLNSEGQLNVRITGEQGSGMLSSMTQANCLIILNPEQGTIASGDTVYLMLFEGLV